MLMGHPPYKPEDAGMAKLHANMMMGRMSRIKDSLSVCEYSARKLMKMANPHSSATLCPRFTC